MVRDLVLEPATTTAHGLKIESASLSRRGSRRKVNEDTVFERVGSAGPGRRVGLFVVCDGLGGLQAGDIASQTAVKTATAALNGVFSVRASSAPANSLLRRWARAAVSQANTDIRNYARAHPAEAGKLGTTIALAVIDDGVAYIASVGDSRAYAWRNGEIVRLTEDHSLGMRLIGIGMLDEAELLDDPRRNVLLRALGRDDQVEPDLVEWPLESGDRLLLCSDGVWAEFADDSEIETLLGLAAPPDAICRHLVAEADRRDGADDMSAIVVSVT